MFRILCHPVVALADGRKVSTHGGYSDATDIGCDSLLVTQIRRLQNLRPAG